MTIKSDLVASILRLDAGERNSVFAEPLLVFRAIKVAANFRFVAFNGKPLDVFTELGLASRRASEQVLEVEFYEAIGSIAFEEATPVFR